MEKIYLTIGIIIAALIAFVAEWLPIDITALCIAVVLMLVGLVTPEEGISGFSNSATITVMAMFILSAGITRTGVIQIVRDWLIAWGGKTPRRQIVILGLTVGPISAFINNTAVVAIFLPIVEDWCKKRGISVSKLLIPLSYITILAGMITLIGTSTNILASGVSKQLGYGEFSIFQFTLLGLIIFGIGLTYLTLAAPHILPERKPHNGDYLAQDYDLKDYLTEVIIPPTSSLIGKTLRASGLQRKFDVDILELVRNKVHLPQPFADKFLDCRCCCYCSPELVSHFNYQFSGSYINGYYRLLKTGGIIWCYPLGYYLFAGGINSFRRGDEEFRDNGMDG